jgi:hypothetical protein
MKDIKDYREKELTMYIIANVLVFSLAHGFIVVQASDIPSSTKVLSEVFDSVVLSAIAFGFILIVECLFTSSFKEKLMYLFGLLHLPGCTIFSAIKEKNPDNRFSYQKLTEKYPALYSNLPTNKETRLRYENEQWYSLYTKHREVAIIHTSQRDWLLCRDIYISTLVMILLYAIVTLSGFSAFCIQYLIYLVAMLAITNYGANRKAKRFAFNVIAYDVNVSSEKEKE